MEIPVTMIELIMSNSQCDWTRGYLKAILDLEKYGPAARDAKALLIVKGVDRNTKNGVLNAVKDLRSKFGLDLSIVDAKAIVDTYCETGKIVFP